MGTARFRAANQQIEKCFGEFQQYLGALIAVGDHQQRAFGELPQQDQIERLGRRGKPRQCQFRIFLPQGLGEHLLKRRVPA